MSTYDPTAQPVLSTHQFRGMAQVSEGSQFGGFRAALNTSSSPTAATAPSGTSVSNTLATFSQAAKNSVL